MVKPAMGETWLRSLGREDPWVGKKGMVNLSSILADRTQMDRNLAGHSPWGRKESDTTEPLTTLL